MPRNDGQQRSGPLRPVPERLQPVESQSIDEGMALLTNLFKSERSHLMAIAQRRLPEEERGAAEDLVQAVFVEAARALRARPQFRPGKGWLVLRLASRIADRHRERNRRPQMEPLEPGAENRILGGAVDPGPGPEEWSITKDYVEGLLKTIPDPIDRATLKLRLHGFAEREIAVQLALSPEAREVRDRLARVRRRLRASEGTA